MRLIDVADHTADELRRALTLIVEGQGPIHLVPVDLTH